ncbi:hypothetical protein NSK_004804 [Nannochloropsis salina CCMP1776]|uniref:Enoyl reductase (ER) domain-containing protein n=2 Tax=Microchloropsis salina TaxID=2511165 RepID=A0A4D9CWV9_9STRA|nr:hypothetical protein NSK_004804 [Nannochloropsis salina CCMP1776]UXO97916.1 Alcohol dehydrogenase 1 [Microchloropsis salina]|eukprot:TFJ83700.1 hypothetical protein NSK_004804 [Nannochloropsis salina CCMP1776]
MASAQHKTFALAAHDEGGVLSKFEIERRALGPKDVKIAIKFCGMCHSDLHQIKGEWGNSKYPMVPGHEIVGLVEAVGTEAQKFKVGAKVGVGVFVDSCRACANCRQGDEQYCTGNGILNSAVFTYNHTLPDGTLVQGGYAQTVVVDEAYVLRIPDNLDLAAAAPLLCAGITVWSPFLHFGVRSHHTIGVVGLGGLGHMAVKFAVAMGCDVAVISHSPGKEALAKKLGAHHFIVISDEAAKSAHARTMDYIVDTVSAPHKLQDYLPFLKTGATLCLVGIPTKPYELHAGDVLMQRLKVAGSVIGGIRETQEMLDFCGRHGITSMIETVPAAYANKAMARLEQNDVKFRFVLDIGGTLSASSPELEGA